MITHMFLPFLGFSQKAGEQTGQHILWERVRRNFGSVPGFYAHTPRPWDTRVDRLVATLAPTMAPDCRTVVAGYSWGGETARQYCLATGRRQYALILCDTPYRSPLWGWRFLAWLDRRRTIDVSGCAERLKIGRASCRERVCQYV